MKTSGRVLLICSFLIAGFIELGAQEIPIEYLSIELDKQELPYQKMILENEINGIHVEHLAISGDKSRKEIIQKGKISIYLFFKGKGNVRIDDSNYEILEEAILVPQTKKEFIIQSRKNDTLHFLKVSTILTDQDRKDLKQFPKENTKQTYFSNFVDCEAYTEAIKSPKTVSRTVLPNKIVPRIAMGTVETTGPDKVDAHEHPMLEQLFLGLARNDVIVYADEAEKDFPAYSVLHIPLGSSHSVEVAENKYMYYMWMDFFRDKEGEEWLKTHKSVKDY